MRRLELPVLVLLLGAGLAVPGCTAGLGERASLPVAGERASLPAISGRAGFNPPVAGQLEAVLQSELARLGKSASDTTPHAPTGAINFAFDLSAAVVDPDGPPDGEGGGVLPPTSITLSWTERLLGDYDENGQVNAADLAPLGMNWQRTVLYDDPALHGGIAYWPDGNPLDDGGSVYPAAPANGSGAQNWRRARVDGKEDGLLNAQDVTPIAQHWYEQSAGYRVYARLPGETEFHVLPNSEDAGSPLTIPRAKTFPEGKSSVDTTRPVSFSFTKTADGGHSGPPYGDDTTALPEGQYEFYLSSYDATTNADGPGSAHVVLDITAGVTNLHPLARVSVSPDFGGAPAVITLDAGLSSDPDGSIVEYRWDLNGDGATDWSTTDASVPDNVGGEIDTITPGAAPGAGLPPTSVTATYRQGHAEYFHPSVTVVDNEGAVDEAMVQLGISGWVRECLNTSETDYKLLFYPNVMSIDPTTHEVVVAGRCTDYSVNYMLATGTYWARRHADGTWETQLMPVPHDGEKIGGLTTTVTAKDIEWDENGKPIVLLDHYVSGFSGGVRNAVWTAQLNASGQWECVERYFASLPEAQAYGSGCGDLVPYAPGKLAGMVSERLYDKPSLDGSEWHFKRYILQYDAGVWGMEYTGYDTADRSEHLLRAISPTTGSVYVMCSNWAPLINGVWWTQWNPGLGLGEPEQISGTAGIPLSECTILGIAVSGNGTMFILYDGTNNRKLVRVKPGGAADYYDFIAEKPQYATYVPYPHGLHAISNGAAFYVQYIAEFGAPAGDITIGSNWRWEADSWTEEQVLAVNGKTDVPYYCSARDAATGQEYLMVSRWYVAEQDWPRQFTGELLYFCTRLDPRIGP